MTATTQERSPARGCLWLLAGLAATIVLIGALLAGAFVFADDSPGTAVALIAAAGLLLLVGPLVSVILSNRAEDGLRRPAQPTEWPSLSQGRADGVELSQPHDARPGCGPPSLADVTAAFPDTGQAHELIRGDARHQSPKEQPMPQPDSGPGEPSWTLNELREELGAFQRELMAAGLAESSVHTYVDRSNRFLRWLAGEYEPRGPN